MILFVGGGCYESITFKDFSLFGEGRMVRLRPNVTRSIFIKVSYSCLYILRIGRWLLILDHCLQ